MLDDHKNAVRKSYDRQASIYKERKSMQTENLNNLINILLSLDEFPRSGSLLDIGCGDGILLEILSKRFQPMPYTYKGCDLSKEMIRTACNSHKGKDNFYVCDAEKLTFKDRSQDIVISNSVLHWLNVPEHKKTPLKAISEAYRVLNQNGKIAASISGIGTAKRFLDAYQFVMNGISEDIIYRNNPIGSMDLHLVVDMFLDCGFSIDIARLDYEPIQYDNPLKYIAVAEAYGYDIFLASLPDEIKRKTWNKISNKFNEMMNYKKFTHNQYMIYIVATRH